MANKDELNI